MNRRTSIATLHPLRVASLVLMLATAFVCPSCASAHADSNSRAPLTAEDLAPFFDGLIPLQMRQNDIAGTVILIVKDGKTLFSKGYGYADVASKKPISPDETLFRVASISKLFTCTAVLQLVEQGKLDLDADVNQYLDFQIPATYSTPITLRNLLTHTAGFQETIRGHDVKDGPPRPLGLYLSDNLPPRIFETGTTPAYSNYGNALAGYIVERVSGQSFESYIKEHIFDPLGMQHSTYLQPLPDELKPFMSSGYLNGSEPARPFQIVQTFPGGGLTASADDVARFMIAHLQDGRLDEAQLLKPETSQLMRNRQFGLSPSMNGSALGFAEQNRNDYRALGHGGDVEAFHSQLFIVPELKLGFFFSQNSRGQNTIRAIIWRSFFDRYFPRRQYPEDKSFNASDPLDFTGSYKTSRRFDKTIFKLWTLMDQVLVSARPDGTINCDLVTELGRNKPLHQVAPSKFCDDSLENCIAFNRTSNGTVQLLGDFPHIIFDRVPWYETRKLNLFAIVTSATIFALTLILWPVNAIVRRYFGQRLELTRSMRVSRIVTRIVCAIDLGILIGGRLLFLKLPNDSIEFWVHCVQALGLIAAIATPIVIYDTIRTWGRPTRWWIAKVGSAVISLACLCFVAFALIWNLFDFSNHF
jgi:CubicO group peptidase (beta-lactamase class C family)